MYKDFVDDLYEKFHEELINNDYIHFAGDTTVIKVPNVSKTKEEFPVEEGKPARARLSTFADVNNGYIFDAKIVEKNTSEAELAIQHLNEIKKRYENQKMSVTYDRGYNSFDLIFTHLDLNIDFLIRLKDSTLHKEIERQMTCDDEIIRIPINNSITRAITDDNLRKNMKKNYS